LVLGDGGEDRVGLGGSDCRVIPAAAAPARPASAVRRDRFFVSVVMVYLLMMSALESAPPRRWHDSHGAAASFTAPLRLSR
jgi:hypothetical protein